MSYMRYNHNMRFTSKISIKSEESKFLKSATNRLTPVLRNERDLIEDYLHVLRKRRNHKYILSKLQLNLLTDIVTHGKHIDWYKNHIKDETDKEKIELLESRLMASETAITALKDLADGLVWRILKYDRPILYILSLKDAPGRLKPHEGIVSELDEWANCFDKKGTTGIFNAITNFLQVGDVTSVSDDGDIEFIEVKKSSPKRAGGRLARQKKQMEETVTFLNTGNGAIDNNVIDVIDLDLNYKFHLKELNKALLNAKSRGVSFLNINNYLLIRCTDFDKISNAEEAISYFEEAQKPIIQQWKPEDKTMDFHSVERNDFSRNFAPLSIFPFNEELCADIMLGRLLISYTVNYSLIVRLFKQSGWEILYDITADQQKAPSADSSFLKVRKEGFVSEIPLSFIGRIVFETLDHKVFIEQLELLRRLTTKEKKPLNYIIRYKNEEKIWD